MRRALQDCGRRVGVHINKKKRAAEESRKRSHIEMFLPQISVALQEILDLSDTERDKTSRNLKTILEDTRKA